MVYVLCDVTPGLRHSEKTVSVKDFQGRNQFLHVHTDFLVQRSDRWYLPVGEIGVKDQLMLVELPEEADSGANRIWVSQGSLLNMEMAQ